MKGTLLAKLGRVPLGILGFIAGTAVVGVAIAQPGPPPLFKVREQNLDAAGAIRVHEQGVLQAIANIANFPSSFSVNNFPATQNVNVTNGRLLVKTPAATAGFSGNAPVNPGAVETITLPIPLNATTISIGKGTDEVAIYFKGPIPVSGPGGPVGPTLFHVSEDQGTVPFVTHSFTQPVPISAVVIHCLNETDLCGIDIDIVGDPAQ